MPTLLEEIHNSTIKFLMPLTIEETYELIVKEAIRLVGADLGSILLENQGELKRVYASDPSLYKVVHRRRGNMYKVFKTQTPRLMSGDEVIKIHPEYEITGVRSDIAIPLAYHNVSIGVLTVMSSKEKSFKREDLDALKLFGSQATLAIRRAQLYDEVKKALEVRDLFIAMAAHEFRTPLTTISGYAQLLYSKLSGANTPESRWVEELLWETKRLTNLVNELLEINRIKSGLLQYVFKECDLKEIISRAISNFKFNHPNRKINYSDQWEKARAVIIGDFDKILQVITNVVDNSVKFSEDNLPINIGLGVKQDCFVISISDQGKGISKKERERVFEGFYKGPSHTKQGMGLGLFLSKKIIEEHHGSIEIKSTENKGTTVQIKLPKVEV